MWLLCAWRRKIFDVSGVPALGKLRGADDSGVSAVCKLRGAVRTLLFSSGRLQTRGLVHQPLMILAGVVVKPIDSRADL